jgi:5-methylcytosine-specific restriction protein A
MIGKLCCRPGCRGVVYGNVCNQCGPKKREKDTRPSAAARGYGTSWRKAARAHLIANPLCVHCLAEKRYTSATVVDHIQPHRGDPTLFWDPTNWQPLCKRHHDRKTSTEDGGFGRCIKTPNPLSRGGGSVSS